MIQMILLPSSYFSMTRVDEDLQNEYEAVINTGLYEICLFDYDKWFNQDQLDLSYTPGKPTVAAYRGWMMKPEQYGRFYGELLNHNIRLITSPEELLTKYRDLPSPFYTIDYAELADGSWRIVEAGDGQVSGLSEGQDYEAFFRALHQCFKTDR